MSLAKIEAFQLGDMEVRPFELRVVFPEGQETLEPKVMEVLTVLARDEGRVFSRDDLIAACWGGRAISDDAIQRVIGRLRRLSEITGGRDFRIETIPRVGYRLTKGETEARAVAVDPDAAITPPATAPTVARPRSRLVLTLLAACAAVLVLVGLLGLGRPTPDRVAILPFDTQGDAQLQAYGAALTQRIAGAMSAGDLDALHVASRDDPALKGAALTFGGTVLRVGETMQVRMELVDVASRVVLWYAEQSRPATEADALQTQVAVRASDMLRCALDARRPDASRLTPETLKPFLRACDLAGGLGGAPDDMVEAARDVTIKAPLFSRGWSLLAMASATSAGWSSPDRATEYRATAADAAKRALELDPRNGEALLAQALLEPTIGGWERRIALIKRAIELEPRNADAHAALGAVYLDLGWLGLGLDSLRRAAALDPLSPTIQGALVPALASTGARAEAHAVRDRLHAGWPQSRAVWMSRLHNALFGDDPRAALPILREGALTPVPMEADERAIWIRYVEALTTGRGDRRALVETFDDRARSRQTAMAPAVSAIAQLGDVDRSFALLDAYLGRPQASTFLIFMPPTAPLRADPRLISAAARVGLVDVWRRAGRWPDYCADPKLTYDCEMAAGATP